MSLVSDHRDDHRLIYQLTGAGLTGSANIGQLPAGVQILRVSVKTAVAGGSPSTPTLAIGISGTTGKYVTAATLTLTAGVATYTVIGTALVTAAPETLQVTYAGGAMPTNATYNAYLIIEAFRVGDA